MMSIQDESPTETRAGPTVASDLTAWSSEDTQEYPTPATSRWRGWCLWVGLVTLLFVASVAASVAVAWFSLRLVHHEQAPAIRMPATVSVTQPPPPPVTTIITPPPVTGPTVTVTPEPTKLWMPAPTTVVPPANTDDQDFLDMLSADWKRHGWHIEDPAIVIHNAHIVCNRMAQPDHPTRLQVISLIHDPDNSPWIVLYDLVSDANIVYCPQYN
jgi:hypothetical protein